MFKIKLILKNIFFLISTFSKREFVQWLINLKTSYKKVFLSVFFLKVFFKYFSREITFFYFSKTTSAYTQ